MSNIAFTSLFVIYLLYQAPVAVSITCYSCNTGPTAIGPGNPDCNLDNYNGYKQTSKSLPHICYTYLHGSEQVVRGLYPDITEDYVDGQCEYGDVGITCFCHSDYCNNDLCQHCIPNFG